ncbi:hypothetical protein JCM3775_006281 [Rhodotorula graminis]|uniref:DUF2423 domain-containing protein n=1 Tax=Rhodotorula graminis (strain WP1) TaxID=578459 RepID=A0A194S284_RHOGW|nr:uncharacterized protein RHOBADRAFT_44144 [Rhodotorula graminis WP1]KPV74629.1 hypothetical protein RHOBADRAFT_44144 [Rhodotorula graminis WP1]
MAKGLRSSKKRAHRAIKREDPNSDYKLKHDLRIQKLNEKLKASALKPRALTDKEEWEREQAGYETVDDDDETAKEGAADKKEGDMEVEGEASTSAEPAPKPKISTSGPRMSRREEYRASKGMTVKQTPRTHFPAMGEKKRMGCKPMRRR